ncbi:lytic transglycosylase domain-containing protein [Sinorhizobium fredii]|uniref:lytic transglycosylase domain-containing protein n=1 Tax=Rhizobium fredii TaxID=380 RepID=UPI0004B5F6DA|nr:lytic transglycosylase domain-containing protein [Sinorhizobium fredii]ASY74347.1 Membrane-bound lytic murein transglycosylase D precursor [Sinorhizobium fredii CCBAU 83666]
MEKRARIAGSSGKAALAGTALLTVILGGICHAQDGHKTVNIIDNKSTWQPQSNAQLATNFEERWQGAEKQFVLAADGVVKQADNAGENHKDFGVSNQIDAALGDSATAADAAHNTNNAQLPTGSITQIGAESHARSGTNEVHECGPSPLKTDEIKALVVQTARKYSVDEVFATAIAWAESGFDQSRNSPKGARGPMQLMPATAARFGVEDVCDPAQNIEGGMKYLRVLLDEFQNPLLVAAAYNSGEQRIYEHGGIPPFQETVGYVAKVVNYQLGLPMPAARSKSRKGADQAASDASDSGDAGVIAVKKTGAFVGGVMHF